MAVLRKDKLIVFITWLAVTLYFIVTLSLIQHVIASNIS